MTVCDACGERFVYTWQDGKQECMNCKATAKPEIIDSEYINFTVCEKCRAVNVGSKCNFCFYCGLPLKAELLQSAKFYICRGCNCPFPVNNACTGICPRNSKWVEKRYRKAVPLSSCLKDYNKSG